MPHILRNSMKTKGFLLSLLYELLFRFSISLCTHPYDPPFCCAYFFHGDHNKFSQGFSSGSSFSTEGELEHFFVIYT